MNRVARFLAPAPDWQAVCLVGERLRTARTAGEAWWALADLFPEHSPYEPLPEHLKAGGGPESALAVLVDGLRDALNAVLERDQGGPGVYVLDEPEA